MNNDNNNNNNHKNNINASTNQSSPKRILIKDISKSQAQQHKLVRILGDVVFMEHRKSQNEQNTYTATSSTTNIEQRNTKNVTIEETFHMIIDDGSGILDVFIKDKNEIMSALEAIRYHDKRQIQIQNKKSYNKNGIESSSSNRIIFADIILQKDLDLFMGQTVDCVGLLERLDNDGNRDISLIKDSNDGSDDNNGLNKENQEDRIITQMNLHFMCVINDPNAFSLRMLEILSEHKINREVAALSSDESSEIYNDFSFTNTDEKTSHNSPQKKEKQPTFSSNNATMGPITSILNSCIVDNNGKLVTIRPNRLLQLIIESKNNNNNSDAVVSSSISPGGNNNRGNHSNITSTSSRSGGIHEEDLAVLLDCSSSPDKVILRQSLQQLQAVGEIYRKDGKYFPI